ncbi:MAG: flavin reductase [Bacteroidota bacterium]|nr:flavin reductase [Bacteroidota bacterium]
MKTIQATEIEGWERFYRANFINSLTGFKSANLIGTVNQDGQTNLAVFSSIIHIGSHPALVGYINRPVAAAPHTLANIEATGSYTLNHIHPSILRQAHQTSAKYPENISEFEKVNLTPQFVTGIQAPFVKESHIKYALSLQEILPITLNQTFLVIGKIEQVILSEDRITEDGFLPLDQLSSIACNGNDAYYHAQLVERLGYAKP